MCSVLLSPTLRRRIQNDLALHKADLKNDWKSFIAMFNTKLLHATNSCQHMRNRMIIRITRHDIVVKSMMANFTEAEVPCTTMRVVAPGTAAMAV